MTVKGKRIQPGKRMPNNKPKWTSGPWKAEHGFIGAERRLFVTSSDNDGILPWTDADALLIAASPDLYAELERSQNILGNQPHRDAFGIIEDQLERNAKALAKARGEQIE